ncbi:MAG: peptidoglycan-binding domain-containing protein [Candidatus Paceibacterota bacterium]
MTKKINLIIGTSLSLAVVMAMLVSVPQASAYTTNITVGTDMTIGSTGANVVALQGLLSELGHLDIPINVPHGYFGAMTQDAVARYQMSQSVTPTAGYFGPVSKVAMHNHFAAHNWLTLLGW